MGALEDLTGQLYAILKTIKLGHHKSAHIFTLTIGSFESFIFDNLASDSLYM